jgi:glycosyltransferase involved in cell wall biosynthesis
MRVCIFTDTIGDLNGVSRFIQDMGEQALSHGVDLHIVSSTAKYCPKMPNVHNLKPRWRFPMPFYSELDIAYPSKTALETKLLELRPDILHISTPGPVGFMARQLAKKHSLPTMGTYHTDFPAYIKKQTGQEWAKRITDKVMQNFYSRFKRVFTRSAEYLDIMDREIGIPKQRSALLYPGTNLTRFHPSYKTPGIFEKYGAKSDGPKVLYVGRISKEKHIPFLIDVWKRYTECCIENEAELILVGEGALRHKRAYRDIEGLVFAGPVIGEDLSRLYATADLFVFPSLTDTLGQVVMEAQASGVACIVSDQGGPQSIVNHNRNPGGMVVRGNDVEDWIEAIETLLKNGTLRHYYGQQGFENMRDFDIAESFEHFTRSHRDVLEALAQ